MKFALRRIRLAAVALCLGAAVGVVTANPAYSILLEKYNEEIRENPQDYLERSERAYFMLEHGKYGQPVGEDIDTLLSHPAWRLLGERLLAIRLYLQGNLDEAKTLILKNIKGNVYVQEQARLLANIELSRKDTAAAIAGYRLAWDEHRNENDFVDLLNLYRGRKKPPEELLQEGMKLYPHSPGAVQTVFEVYLIAGGQANLEKAAEISGRAEKILWPLSADWKVRHARVLLALKQLGAAETVLLQALDVLDADPRLRENTEIAPQLRREIFVLLEKARRKIR